MPNATKGSQGVAVTADLTDGHGRKVGKALRAIFCGHKLIAASQFPPVH